MSRDILTPGENSPHLLTAPSSDNSDKFNVHSHRASSTGANVPQQVQRVNQRDHAQPQEHQVDASEVAGAVRSHRHGDRVVEE